MTAWTRSLPSVPAMRELVAREYGLLDPRVTLIRSFVNDVYRIDDGGRRCALKVYRAGRFSADEVRWEQDLAEHLRTRAVPASRSVLRGNGDTAGLLDAPEGPRPYAMTEWVPGRKPADADDAVFAAVGAALARFHLAVDGFSSRYPRRDPRAVDHSAAVLAAVADDPLRHRLVRISAERAREQLQRLADRGLRRGVCHGDPSLDNVHLDGPHVWFYDLDLAGIDYQATDLTGATSTSFAEVYLAGYTGVRPLSPVDLEALPWLRVIAAIDNLYFHLVDKPSFLGTDTLGEGWVDDGFAVLAAEAGRLGLGA